MDPATATGLTLTAALTGLVLTGAVVGVLTLMVRRETGLVDVDHAAEIWADVHSTTFTDDVLAVITHLGDTVTIISVGHGVQIALRALAADGLSAFNVDVFGVARFPWDFAADFALLDSVKSSRNVIVVEEHYLNGGMAESLRLALPEVRTFRALSAAYSSDQRYGSPLFHLQQCGLTPENLVASVETVLGKQ